MRKPVWIAFAVALSATLWAAMHEGGETVEPVKSTGRTASRPGGGQGGAHEARSAARAQPPVAPALAPALAQGIAAWKQREPLGLKSERELAAWGPSLPRPAPAQVVKVAEAAPPPPPQAPRFPHQWVGRFNDMAVVSGPRSTWVLAEGQVIEGQWRVDQIRERQMQLTYLPFKQAQTVAMQTP
ncbi:MAG: hypothetical protein ACM3VZ_13455 [Acidobacteriota bacterium]